MFACTPVVSKAWTSGAELSIHGLIYRLEDGRLLDLGLSISNHEESATLTEEVFNRRPNLRARWDHIMHESLQRDQCHQHMPESLQHMPESHQRMPESLQRKRSAPKEAGATNRHSIKIDKPVPK